MGGIVCIFLVLTWLLFAVNQSIVLFSRADYQILDKSFPNEISHYEFHFGKSNGFAIAAGFIDMKNLDVRDGDAELSYVVTKTLSY